MITILLVLPVLVPAVAGLASGVMLSRGLAKGSFGGCSGCPCGRRP